MATESILNIEDLLQPISEDAPCGVDLRADESPDAVYYELKDARNNARAIERNSFPGDDNEDHLEKDHWKLILKKAPEVIKTQSKDLEVAAWLTEALIRQHGFAGLKNGIELLNGLVQNFWDGLYPLPDEDGISTRVAVLVGLNGINNTIGTLVAPINTAPLTADGVYSAWSYSQAQELDKTKDPATKKKKIEAGAVPVDTIKNAVKPSQSEFYMDLDADIQTTMDAYAQLSDKLDELCGDDTPPSSNIRKALEKAQAALQVIAKPILMPEEPEVVVENNEDNTALVEIGAAPQADVKISGNIKGRLEAFKTLQTVADFFKRTEPHSPIGYTLEKVVRWGDMSLPELLQELVPDPQAKDYYEKVVGILPPQMDHGHMQQNGMMPQQPGMDHMQQPQYNDYNDYNGGGMDQYNGGSMDQYNGGGGDFPPAPGGYDNPLFK